MRTIYLLRHGKSSWKNAGIDDFDRPLAKRGRRAATAMGHYLHSQRLEPALILCSPSRRTRETLERLHDGMTATTPTRFEKSIYMGEAGLLLRRLNGLSDSLPSAMIVGHNPGLEQLAALLVASEATAGNSDHADAETRSPRQLLAEKFPTGSLAVIVAAVEHWQDLNVGCGQLERFVRARDLDGGK